jgi:hypothetical protein
MTDRGVVGRSPRKEHVPTKEPAGHCAWAGQRRQVNSAAMREGERGDMVAWVQPCRLGHAWFVPRTSSSSSRCQPRSGGTSGDTPACHWTPKTGSAPGPLRFRPRVPGRVAGAVRRAAPGGGHRAHRAAQSVLPLIAGQAASTTSLWPRRNRRGPFCTLGRREHPTSPIRDRRGVGIAGRIQCHSAEGRTAGGIRPGASGQIEVAP